MLIASSSDSVQQIVACSRELYTLPRVAMQVLDLTSQENVDIPALRRCIEHDPALTTKVLRVVNSSLFGLPRQVADLNHALTLLGVKPLKMLVLGFSLPPDLFNGLENELLQQYWRRSIIKAVAAKETSRRWGRTDPEEMLIAGLLQDIGILVLLQQLGLPYCRFVKQLWQAGNQLTLCERELFGFDHTEITARLMNSWRLPPQLSAAVRAPDQLSPALPQPVTILWLAELTTAFLISGDAEQLAALYQSLSTWKQVPAQHVETFLIDLQVQIEQLAGVFSQDIEPVDYAALIREAQQRLADESSSLSEALAVQAREVKVDREQWSDLIDALENLPPAEELEAAALPPAEDPVPEPETAGELPRLENVLGLKARRSLPIRAQAPRADFESVAEDTVFVRQVAQAASLCRTQRQGLSLMLIEIDRAEEMMLTRGVASLGQLRDDAESWLSHWHCVHSAAVPLGDNCFAFLLPAVDRLAAASLARRLTDALANQADDEPQQWHVTFSVGIASIALPPKNFAPADMVEAAQRCLDAARRAGGNCTKGIEIY